ncbi:MAG: tetratricopeptide repeat protein [Candidatus Aminicenantales bacterium]
MSKKTILLLAAGLILSFCTSTQKKPSLNPDKDPQYQYEKAVISVRYGLEGEALKYLNEALAFDPAHAPSLKLLGTVQFKKNNFQEAAAALERYLALQPDDSEAHTSLGITYDKLGQAARAESEYQRAIALDGNPEAGFGLAKLYYDQNKLEAALEIIHGAIQKNPRSAAYYNLQGVILNQMGRYGEALTSFQNALRNAPDDIYLMVNLGIAYINNRQPDKARELLEKALPSVQDEGLKAKINEYLKLIKDNQ